MSWFDFLGKTQTLTASTPATKACVRTKPGRSGKAARLPRHVAIILDGNGRWATRRGLPRPAGHAKGVEAVREVIQGSLDSGIRVLSLFAFSVQNWKRPDAEVEALMDLLQYYLDREGARLAGEGVTIRLMGERERLPAKVVEAIENAETHPVSASRLTLNLAVNYGGREELVRAMQRVALRVAGGGMSPNAIDEPLLERHLFTSDLPPVDLLIRTAGERRLSNFMLWQAAYAELLFSETLWPDFTREDLNAALADYARRRRTFGGLVDLGAPNSGRQMPDAG